MSSELHRHSSQDIIQVTVHFCDNLKSNILLLQPVLYMHVVDANTGTYVKKSDRNRAVVSFYENQRNDIDYIMPVMTQICPHVSGDKQSLLNWEEVFILNEQFKVLVDKESNIMLFFEIVDLSTISYTKHHYERLNQNGTHKIAWSFLKIIGSNGVINTGSKLRLQLYKPFKTIKQKAKPYIEVYRWWLKKTKIPMKASLMISVEPHAIFVPEPALRSMLPLQQEKGSTTFEKLSASNKTSLDYSNQPKSAPVHTQDTEVTWSRKDGEACMIPKQKMLSLDVVFCCEILKFSAYGRVLAVGCGSCDCHYLMFYEIPNGKLLRKVLAHSEHIYDLDWSYNDKYLLSASSDYSVKMWDTSCWSLKEMFVHPSYVYCARFHPAVENIFASSCHDHIIRIWALEKCQLLKELEAHNSTVCALCWNASGTKLYSADVIGQIKVWGRSRKVRDDSYLLENEINLEETKHISIRKMTLDSQEKTLCLFCNDSVARILFLENGQVLSTFEPDTSTSYLSKGCCSPCGNLVFLCCDKGNVSVWNKNCSKREPELLFDSNYGAVSCMDYHPHEHMLAISFWNQSFPVQVFIHKETGPKKEEAVKNGDTEALECDKNASHKNKMHFMTNKNNKAEKCDSAKQSIKSEKQPHIETHIDVTTSGHKKRGPAKYKAHKLDETCLSGSLDMYPTKLQDGNRKQSLTAVITKSGQFDVIAVPDDSAGSDSNTFRSFGSDPAVLNRSSKRSQRRKKLRDMHKAQP